jgi:hypothetical protein
MLPVYFKIGRRFELELNSRSLYLRCGSFERYWNAHGLPSH